MSQSHQMTLAMRKKIVAPSILSKTAIMPRVVSERGLQPTLRSKSDCTWVVQCQNCYDGQVGTLPLLSIRFEVCREP